MSLLTRLTELLPASTPVFLVPIFVAGPLVRSSYRAHEHRPDPRPLHIG